MGIGSGQDPGERETKSETRPAKLLIAALVCLVGTSGAFVCYSLISNAGEPGRGSVAATAGTVSAATSAKASPPPTASAGKVPASPAGSPTPHPLTVTSVSAFGPEGTSDGDNPAIASRVLGVSTDQPWYSQWYATPEFGNLRSGTGLLLSLGKTARVRDVQLVLGSAPGAVVQVRVGSSPSLELPVVASAAGVGGTVLLTATAAATGRYVLIWFTRLPPDGHGHYQVSVYNVRLDG